MISFFSGCTFFRSRWLVSGVLFFCLLVGMGPHAKAGPIPANEVRFALENIVVDTEFAFLVSFGGVTSGGLDYFSEITNSGWTGTLSGTYANRPLSIVYVGDTTDLSSMSWAGTGTWGTESWSSSGTAGFTDPPLEGILDLDNMQVGLSASGSIGVGSITVKLLKDLDDRELTGSVEVSALDVPVLGSALSKELSLTLSQEDFTYTSREEYQVLFGLARRADVVNGGRLFRRNPAMPNEAIPQPGQPLGPGFQPGFNGDPGGITLNQMQIQAVPEPATLFLVLCGLLLLALVKFQQRYVKSHRSLRNQLSSGRKPGFMNSQNSRWVSRSILEA